MKSFLPFSLLLAACAGSADPKTGQAELDKFAQECGLPAGTFALRPDGMVVIGFKPDTPSKAADCGLKKLSESPYRSKLGFLGNEVYQSETK